jgi:RND family efflux transporter MFP subunit
MREFSIVDKRKNTSHRLLLVILAALCLSCSEPPEETRPIYGSMTEAIYASAIIQPKGLYNAFAATQGIIEEVMVNEGDTVAKGQILARLSVTQPRISMDNARLNADLAREKYQGQNTLLSSIKTEIAANDKQIALDSLNYFRQTRLWEQGIGAKAELESKKLRYDLGLDRRAELKKRYRQTRLDLESNYKQSKNALAKAESTLGDFHIKSNINGRVYSLFMNTGELIGPQQPLARIGESGAFIIEMAIDEVDIAKVKTGQMALIVLDAYPGQAFEAEVSKIYPQKDDRTQTFKVEAVFKQAPARLYSGLSGEVNIVLSKKEGVLVIPLEYLLEGDKVRTAEGERPVQIGVKNFEYAEILSGIDTSTVIQKP